MRSFKDRNGRDWPIDIDLATLTRVRAETGVQLVDLVLGDAGAALAGQYEKVGELLYSVCAEEATKRAVAPEAFAKLFDGDVVENAMLALAEAVADFLPRSRRELATKVIAKGTEVTRLAVATAVARVDGIDAASLVSSLSGGSTSSPASPASTPAA